MRNLTQLLLFMLQNENDCGDLGSVDKQEDEQQQMEGGKLWFSLSFSSLCEFKLVSSWETTVFLICLLPYFIR